MAADQDPEARAESERLKVVSQAELAAGGKLQELGSLAPTDWTEYTAASHLINDYLNLYDGGEDVDRPEWHRALHELSDARKMLANNADVAIRKAIEEATAHLSSERSDLGRVVAALEDVKSAIDDAEEAQRLVGVIMKLKDLAEFAEHPSVGKAIGVVRGSHEDRLIEEGIGNLAQYDVLLTLVGHGFASVEELKARVETARRGVAAAAEGVEQTGRLHDIVTEYSTWTPDP
jgi:hypothetical protein